MGESLDSKIKKLRDGETEEKLREKIRKRLIKIGQDKQSGGRNTKDLGKIWENCIEPVDRLRKSRNMPGLDGWYCGLGQLIDWTDPEIYAVLPYLLTSYMYNFCLRTRKKALYLDSRWATGNTLVEKFLEAYKLTGKQMNGKALFRLENANLPKKGIGALLFETEDAEELYVENTQLWRQIDYLARDFIFPEMKTCESISLETPWLSESIGLSGLSKLSVNFAWIPKMFRQDAKELAKELKKAKKEMEKELDNRNTAESITISELQDIYIAWFYVFYKHREMFEGSFQLDPVTSTILFYKNISTTEILRKRLEQLGVKDEDNVENAGGKIRMALLARYDQRVGQNQ